MLTSNDDDDDDDDDDNNNNNNEDDEDNNNENYDYNDGCESNDHDLTTNAILSLSSVVSNTKNIKSNQDDSNNNNNFMNGNNNYQFKHQQHRQNDRQQHNQQQQQYGNSINHDNMILPFLRFENNKRILDIQFMDFCEMKACLELIVNNPSVTVRTSLMN